MSVVIIFAELGGFLLLVVLAAVIYYFRKVKREGGYTKELVSTIKRAIPKRRGNLTTHFKDKVGLEENEIGLNVEALIDKEKKLYEHLINVSVHKDTSLLKLTINDINTLINDYVRMLTLKGNIVANEDRDSRELQLRKENGALRVEIASLQKRLHAETETIENMMSEFSSMYEGGKKEGEQRVKNEMYKLKQSLNAEEVKVKSEVKNLDLDFDENDS
jgi:hypothetical protein